MTYREYIDNARKTFKEHLDGFLEGKGLHKLNAYVDSFLQVDQKNLSLAVYPDAPSGKTYEETESVAKVGFTVCFYLNEDMSLESSEEAITYYSALIEFIKANRFSETDIIAESVLTLMEMGEPKNGAFFLIESRLASFCDYY